MKNVGIYLFYLFLITFILLAYLYKNNYLSFFNLKIESESNIAEIEFREKSFSMNSTEMYRNSSIEIADFEKNEEWKGIYNFDDANVIVGSSSITITSKNEQKVIMELTKSFSLDSFNIIKLLIFSKDEDNSNNIKNALIRFSNKNASIVYEYGISNLKTGWNTIIMRRDNFTLINKLSNTDKLDSDWPVLNKISFELISRPNTTVEIGLDRLWAEKNDEYQNNFLAKNYGVISLKEFKNNNYIYVWPFPSSPVLIKKITSVKDFIFTLKIIPQKKGSFSITGRTNVSNNYGYYLEMSGINSGAWKLLKVRKPVNKSSLIVLKSGIISNFTIDKDRPIWLRLEFNKNKVLAFFSIDGINFTKLAEATDSEHKSGGVGFTTKNGSYLIESVSLSQK